MNFDAYLVELARVTKSLPGGRNKHFKSPAGLRELVSTFPPRASRVRADESVSPLMQAVTLAEIPPAFRRRGLRLDEASVCAYAFTLMAEQAVRAMLWEPLFIGASPRRAAAEFKRQCDAYEGAVHWYRDLNVVSSLRDAAPGAELFIPERGQLVANFHTYRLFSGFSPRSRETLEYFISHFEGRREGMRAKAFRDHYGLSSSRQVALSSFRGEKRYPRAFAREFFQISKLPTFFSESLVASFHADEPSAYCRKVFAAMARDLSKCDAGLRRRVRLRRALQRRAYQVALMRDQLRDSHRAATGLVHYLQEVRELLELLAKGTSVAALEQQTEALDRSFERNVRPHFRGARAQEAKPISYRLWPEEAVDYLKNFTVRGGTSPSRTATVDWSEVSPRRAEFRERLG